jgi:sialate O-acetylesterase
LHKKHLKKMRSFIIAFCLISFCTKAQISLPRLVSDGAVLQRDEPLKLWGKASPKEKLTITIDGQKYKTQADATGSWVTTTKPHAAGGPYIIHIKGKTELTVSDVLFGDVWLCTGQSNMVLNMERVKEKYADDIAAASYPHIRNFFIKTMTDLNGPQTDLPDGKWQAVTPKSVLDFGAVSYFFAREIYLKHHIPIGIVNASVGGTPIEAWISENGLRTFDNLQKTIAQNKDKSYVENRQAEARRRAITRPNLDQGSLQTPKWYEPSYQAKGWQNINIPGYWEDQGLNNLDGIVWYRREIDLPASMVGPEAKLYMGRIVDADQMYLNGQAIGNVTYQYPPRRYTIPAGLLKPGKNILTIRVQNTAGKGGFVPDKPYFLLANGQEYDLKGTWQYKIGQVYEPLPNTGGGGLVAQNQPAALYNAMTAPVVNQLAIKGVLWYQGESNTGNPKPYEAYLKALVNDYRQLFAKPQLPFLWVQLANFMEQDLIPTESNWAQLREAQRLALSLPNTAMAVTTDLGEWNDIHPLNKKDVGLRLSLAARALSYNEQNLTYSGPIYKSHSIQGGKVTLSFDHTATGLQSTDGEPLKYFAIAGTDRKYHWATAQIVNNTVELSSEKVPAPVYIRYAWANNPVGANLSNSAGLPASPFEAGTKTENKLWQGKKAAIVLTYDDALDVHLDNALPILDSLGLKASFYLTASVPASKNRIEAWRRAARNGHELGNHTLYHPCDASRPGRSWVTPANDLSKYSTTQIQREVEMTNTFLEAIDGKKERTFAYTCGDTSTAEGSFIPAIKNQFVALRGVKSALNLPASHDITNLNCYVIDNANAEQLITWAEQAKAQNALMVVLFHGVGGGHNINTDLDKHNAFLKYLKTNEADIWTTTLLEASKNLLEHGK